MNLKGDKRMKGQKKTIVGNWFGESLEDYIEGYITDKGNFLTNRKGMDMERKGKSVGFTLIEMLTVIGIIAILAAILMPALSSARRSARATAASGDIQNIKMAMEMYAQDFYEYPSDKLSDLKGWEDISGTPTSVNYSVSDRKDSAGAALVFALSQNLEDSGTDPYMEFKSERLKGITTISSDTTYVFQNPFKNVYYRFRNNEDSGAPDDSTTYGGWDSGTKNYVDEWDVCYVNRSGVDIWTADHNGRDFVDRGTSGTGAITSVTMPPTWKSLRSDNVKNIKETYHSITNW
ncbi:hypothetical protein AKJ51_04475 [candidate division MSBL1 archaeon SCGC-AAA382A20]|uniref:Type II secretion system protein GspG C-terminal domain-containing protein n=1 Tax=candidate division MSBL1 archaeon SCGC-AAA382A20 TaxID=1698280 RepID=A0A133VHL6_9EURY|nr:hypothetical protein AKJ51_04475 [candidate division MSBL1 archaeon SCGC-AAA382A20]